MNDRNTIENARAAGFTLLAVWLTCTTVSVLGMALPWEAPKVPAKTEKPPPVELLDIALSDSDAIAAGETAAAATAVEMPEPSTVSEPPPLQEMPALEEAPPLIALAESTPEIALPKPVDTSARIVPRQQAESGSRQPAATTTTAAAAAASRSGSSGGAGTAQGVQTLVFGQGEGRQPAPPYPSAAKLGGQQGTVVVRLTVGADGRVQDAEAIRPCPWPSLNQSALRTIRSRWRFQSGATRSYQIAIRFHLQ